MDQDKSQLEKLAELVTQKWQDNTTGNVNGCYMPIYPQWGGGCPSCGYCQHCGRGGRSFQPYFTYTGTSTQFFQNT